jgi:hypothetical protein
MLFGEELYYYFCDLRLFEDSSFCTFSITVAIWNNFLGLSHNLTQGTCNTTENNESDARIKTERNLRNYRY